MYQLLLLPSGEVHLFRLIAGHLRGSKAKGRDFFHKPGFKHFVQGVKATAPRIQISPLTLSETW
jgi:hypothetical protein